MYFQECLCVVIPCVWMQVSRWGKCVTNQSSRLVSKLQLFLFYQSLYSVLLISSIQFLVCIFLSLVFSIQLFVFSLKYLVTCVWSLLSSYLCRLQHLVTIVQFLVKPILVSSYQCQYSYLCLAFSIQLLMSTLQYLVNFFQFLVSCFYYLVSSVKFLVPSIQYLVSSLNVLYLVQDRSWIHAFFLQFEMSCKFCNLTW